MTDASDRSGDPCARDYGTHARRGGGNRRGVGKRTGGRIGNSRRAVLGGMNESRGVLSWNLLQESNNPAGDGRQGLAAREEDV